MRGFLSIFLARWGLRHSNFRTRWPNAIEPPGPRQQQHNNQTMDERVGAQVTRGDCMGGRLDLPFLPCCYCAKKKGCFGLAAVVSLGQRDNNTRYNRTCHHRAVAKLPLTSHCCAATTAAAPPFVGWLLRCCPPSNFVIACRHATINALIAGRLCR